MPDSKLHTGYCDHCGEQIPMGDACAVGELPRDITSANTGESAILCADCYVIIMSEEPTEDSR